MQAYSDPSRENDPHALPDLEVWQAEKCNNSGTPCDSLCLEAGKFYYWHCLPGCLPDSDPVGPFDTMEDALADAREGMEG